jgi:hypothetical protein
VNSDNETDSSPGWLDSRVSSRSALRLVTLLLALGAVYLGVGSLFKPLSQVRTITDNIDDALVSFVTIDALMVLFACCYHYFPTGATELNARISARGVMRWLAFTATAGCIFVCAYACLWANDVADAFRAAGCSVYVWVAFALVYGCYANCGASDRVASRRSLCRNGTARQALVHMAGLSMLGLLFISFAGNPTQLQFMGGICGAWVTLLVFTVTSWIFHHRIHLDYDRG